MNVASSPARQVEVAHIMGTAVSIHVMGDLAPEVFAAAAEACFAHLRRADRVFSPYRDDSDLLRIRRGELSCRDADPWVAEISAACARAEDDTGGLFSATWSGVWDPTGFVKGWAVEGAARAHLAPLLERASVVAAGVNAGGDLQLFTAPDSDWTWNVGIADPADPGMVLATVAVREGAVATSGPGERGSHIVDPRSGAPARGMASATVVSAGLAHADAWATAAVVAGFDDLGWLPRAGVTRGVIVSDDGRVRRWLDSTEVSVVGIPDGRSLGVGRESRKDNANLFRSVTSLL